jgi:hypothetical protein
MSRVEWWTALGMDALVAIAGVGVRSAWSTSTGQSLGVALLVLAAAGFAATLWRARAGLH